MNQGYAKPRHVLRMNKVREVLKERNLDALFIQKPQNIFYLTGFRGDDSAAILTKSSLWIITDTRYQAELEDVELPVRVVITGKKSLFEHLLTIVSRVGVKNIGFEDDFISYARGRNLMKRVNRVKWRAAFGIIESVRLIKDATEIKAIKKAICIAESSLVESIQSIDIKGVTENSLAAILECRMRMNGAHGPSFPSIVAQGAASAFPHAVPRNRKIGKGIILIDFGARVEGYCSDLTRVFVSGKISRILKERYRLVFEAQQYAASLIKPGMSAADVDRRVRLFFKNHGVSQYVMHSLGHGIGLDVHEIPALSLKNDMFFEKDMIFTIEPGLYFEGWGGLRLEDMYRVSETGCVRMSTLPQEIIQIA